MNKIFVVLVEATKDGNRTAHSETIKTGENLLDFMNRYKKLYKATTEKVIVCESATSAAYLAENLKAEYKSSNTLLE